MGETMEGVEEGAGDMELQRTASGSVPSRRTKPKHAVGREKQASMASKEVKRSKAANGSAKKNNTGAKEKETKDELTPVSRKELLEKALRAVARDLDAAGKTRPTNTIGNLVQLLKLDRSFREDEEQPHEIRVVWEEKQDETLDDLPERKSEASPRT